MLESRLRQLRRQLLIGSLLCAAGASATAAVAGTDAAVAAGLGDALRATLSHHPAVAGKEAEVQAKRYAAQGVRSQRYPTFMAQAQQYADRNRSVLSGDDLSQPAILRIRQPIWAFGRISNNIAEAKAEVSTERADLLRVRRQLLEQTAVAYAQVRGSQAQIDVARENVARHQALLEQIQRRVKGQLASSADARLAATRLAQAQALLEHAISDRLGAQDDLTALTQVAVSTDEPVPPALLELPADLIERAMAQSAEIQVKQQQLAQAEAEVDRARTSAMPTVYLQADKFYDQPGLRDDSQVSVVFEATLDGLGFAARGRTAEAVAGRTAATQDLAAAKVALRQELEGLERNRRLQSQLITLQTQSLADLEALLASYERQYESGTKSWLDLMNVQRELFEQRRQLAQAQSDWQVYSLQLLVRTGGLDSVAGINEGNHD